VSKQFDLFTLIPTHKFIGRGVLSIDKNGKADFFEGDGGEKSKILASLTRVKIDGATADGLHFSGFHTHGRGRVHYQEWFLAYQKV
jgi:hypothetical protein